MKYFRHFSNASSSLKIQKVLDQMGLEGYAQYFLLLELLNEKFDGKNTKIELHFNEISAKVRIKFSKKLETFVQKLADFSLLSYQLSGKVYEIDCPMLLELMDKDSKYNRKKRSPDDQDATLEGEVNKDRDLKLDLNKEEREKSVETFSLPSGNITTDVVLKLFNAKLGGVGKIKHTPFFMPSAILEDFKILTGFSDFQKVETWENYFTMASQSSFITQKLAPSLAWFFKSENAFKVLGGQYQDREAVKKPDEKIPEHMNANASAWAFYAYKEIIADEVWLGESDFDLDVLQAFGDVSRVRQSDPKDRNEMVALLKDAYLKTSLQTSRSA